MGSDGETIGIWVPEDDTTVDDFDRVLGNKLGSDYTRSSKVKDAMDLYRVVEELLDELDYREMDEASKRHFVRQAILEEDRRDRERNGGTGD